MVLDINELQTNTEFNASQWLNKVLQTGTGEAPVAATGDGDSPKSKSAGSRSKGSTDSATPTAGTTAPAGGADKINVEKLLKALSAEVDEAISKSNANIRNIAENMFMDLPIVLRELDKTQKEIACLQQDVTVGLSVAQNVQKKTSTSMTTLEKLDSMKTKVVTTSQALQEADKWTFLAKQIEQLLEAGDVNKSYETILGMEKSLSVLNPTQAEERRLILEEMKNRLEALATKHLILAFDTNNIDNAKYFFTMFVNLDRVPQYIKYFQTCEKMKLTQDWRKYVETMVFKEASVKLYDSIVDHWHAKLPWCKIIFADVNSVNPFNVLIDLYTDTLRSLEPSLQFCFESETKKQPFIDILIHFNQTTDRFVQQMRQLVESHSLSSDPMRIDSFLKVCFTPFLAQYENYARYHEKLIYSKVQAATVASVASSLSGGDAGSDDSGSGISILQERIESSKRLLPEIILLIKEGEERVKIFNRGFGYLHFGKGLSSGLERFAQWNQDIFRFMVNSIDGSFYSPSEDAYQHQHQQQSKKSSSQSQNQNQQQQRQTLENVLAFTEICGEILRQITKLDGTLSTNCSRVFSGATKGKDKNNGSAWDDMWSYYVDSPLKIEIFTFLQKKEPLLSKAVTLIKKLCRDATQLVLKVTAEPIYSTLMGKSFTVADSSLKEAIPSEYITHIGEYLMLLPQNLETFILSENSSISYAFDQTSEEVGRSPVDFIIASLASSACQVFFERILKINSLTEGQAKQLAQDIDYFDSVLEDLGPKLTGELTEVSKLLKNHFMTNLLSDSSLSEKFNQKVLNALKKMKISAGNNY